MNLATRISRISVSKTMAVMEAAIKLRDQGIDVVDFGPGEPDFPTPENVKQAGIRAIQADFTKYTAIGGIKELKKAIVEDAEFGRIARLCRERNVYLLSDECYSHFLYDGRKPFSVASYTDLKSHIVIAGSLSKTYSMTGWRIGYVLALPEIIDGIVKLQSHSTSNPTSVSQKAALEALSGPQESVGVMLAEYARRRKFVLERLRAIPGVKCAEPGGTFYAYPNISAAFGRGGIRDSVDFSARLLEKAHVAVTPGEAFGTAEHVRISYATSMEQLDKGLKRIHEFMASL